jgi:uncharacterized membrane protein YhaH (DUF805 family)
MVTFTEATVAGFKNALTFGGRASRSEYWWFVLANFLLSIAASVLTDIFQLLMLICVPIQIWAFLAILALQFRRLRDAGGSIWWMIGSLGSLAMVVIFAILTALFHHSASLAEPFYMAIFFFLACYSIAGIVVFIYTLLPSKAPALEESEA